PISAPRTTRPWAPRTDPPRTPKAPALMFGGGFPVTIHGDRPRASSRPSPPWESLLDQLPKGKQASASSRATRRKPPPWCSAGALLLGGSAVGQSAITAVIIAPAGIWRPT